MTTEPIFDAIVRSLAFDPSAVPPSSTRAERERAHEVWWQQTLRKAAARPVSRRRVSKKAAS